VALAAVLAGTALAAGCGHAPRPVPTVAILPVDSLGVAPGEGVALGEAVVREVARGQAARPASPARVGAAAADVTGSGGRDSAAGLAVIGRRVPAELVLSLGLAGLGDLRLVRSRLVRTEDGLALQDLQETVQGGGPALERYAAGLARRLFPEAVRRPWYRSWWFFASVAAVAGATAVITWAAVPGRGHEAGVIHLGDLR
jgi:hypothetical protein